MLRIETVIFDPHATHLPGISATNPGIKIRFADSDLPAQFPDQFAPFKNVFGCDLKRHYKGTLFRFPLRHAALAEVSEIKRRACSPADILELFRAFKESIASTMLFLRNVRQVDVYIQTDIDQPPVLLYGAEVPAEDRGESWRQIDKFMATSDSSQTAAAAGVPSKRAFYARLRRTAENELPSVTQIVHIRSYEHEEFQECISRIQGGRSSVGLSSGKSSERTLGLEKYLVCNQLGGGRAREIACAAENESLKLIPWAGIAGRIGVAPVEGRAFCFLPLPVKIGLPVHVNGYFELSSNRRDIWHGDDMTGDGKLRSDWNESLLRDAVAPAYLSFLLEARNVCGDDMEQYLSFFPSQVPPGPWAAVVRSLFRAMETQPVFAISPVLSDESATPSRRYVAPKSCVVVDTSIPRWEPLELALATASVATTHTPASLRELLVQLDAVRGSMTPAFFCTMIKRGDFLPHLSSDLVARVVEFCTGGTNGSPTACELLHDLPLLPLRNGTFGTFRYSREVGTDSMFYFGSLIEEELLASFSSVVIVGEYKQYFEALPELYSVSNVRKISANIIARHFFPKMFPGCWKRMPGDHYGVLALEDSTARSSSRVSCNWLRQWWNYFELNLQAGDAVDDEMVKKWPIVPVKTHDPLDVNWVALASDPCLLVGQIGTLLPDLESQISTLLCKIGIFVVDSSFIYGERSTEWLLKRSAAFKFDSDGLLLAVSKSRMKHPGGLFEEVFSSITPKERQALCEFFAVNGVDAVSDACLQALKDLPIFPVHSGSAYHAKQEDDAESLVVEQEPERVYSTLRQRRIVPASDANQRVLDEGFFVIDSDAMRKFFRDLECEEWSYTTILMAHVFPRLQVLETNDPALVDEVVIDTLVSLPFHQRKDSNFRERLQSLPVVPSRKRVLRRINELHDPTSKELSELVGSTSLPSDAFSKPDIVEILRSLGLRTSVSCHAILESARSVESLYAAGDAESVELAWTKAVSLVKIANNHFDEMATSTSGEEEEEVLCQDSIDEIVDALKNTVWLPVYSAPPDSSMPWKSDRQNERRKRLSNAVETRPEKDAVSCCDLCVSVSAMWSLTP